jgi:hypothetical protein
MKGFNPKQAEAWVKLHDNSTRFLFFGGAAGGGKSYLLNKWLISGCELYPGTRWLMARNVLKYLKETTLTTFFKVCQNQYFTNEFNYNAQSGIIKWHNGSEIILRELKRTPSDPLFQDLGSLELTGAAVDEAPEITFQAFDVLKSRVNRQLNEKYGLAPKILLTGNPVRNWVHTTFIKKPPSREYQFIQSLVDDNIQFIDKGYVESLESISDKVTRQRLRYGNWDYDDDPAILIQYAKILELYNNSFVAGGEKYLTCDVARKGKDKSVICCWDGWRCIEIIQLPTNTITGLADLIRQKQQHYNIPLLNIIVDEDGIGGGLVDILCCNGFVNNSRPAEQHTQTQHVENFDNLRSQCIFKFCSFVNDNKVFLQCEDMEISERINEELSVIRRRDVVSDGKVSIMGRDEFVKSIGRSPDFLSALMQRVWFDIAKRDYKPAKFNFL